MSDVTRLLDAAAAGDRQAAADLLPLVYDELRKLAAARMAAEAPGHTLSPPPWSTRRTSGWSARPTKPAGTTAGTSSPPPPRPCAASSSTPPAASGAEKHGGDRHRVELTRRPGRPRGRRRTTCSPWTRPSPGWPPRTRSPPELVELRYFAGLSIEEAAAALGISRATADRHWTFARAWLRDAVAGAESG